MHEKPVTGSNCDRCLQHTALVSCLPIIILFLHFCCCFSLVSAKSVSELSVCFKKNCNKRISFIKEKEMAGGGGGGERDFL